MKKCLHMHLVLILFFSCSNNKPLSSQTYEKSERQSNSKNEETKNIDANSLKTYIYPCGHKENFHTFDGHFAFLIDMDEYMEWIEERHKSNAVDCLGKKSQSKLVLFIQRFNISKEKFIEKLEDLNRRNANLGIPPVDIDVDLIYTFDHTAIEKYYRTD